jgi:HSP20 family protein
MRTRVQAIVVPSETEEFGDDLRRVFAEMERAGALGGMTGECSPALDVFETDNTVEITVDLPGVPVTAIRVIVKNDTVLIAGEKAPRRARGDSSFHLVERGYGRFARAVQFGSACDTGRARATLSNGELHVSLPKITDRRSRTIPIAVTTEPAAE